MKVNLKSASKQMGQFTALIDKPTKTLFSTLKQHENLHEVPGGPGLDADVFQFAHDVFKLSNLQTYSSSSPQYQFIMHVYQFAAPDSKMNCTLRGSC
jgi:hypothetical protein